MIHSLITFRETGSVRDPANTQRVEGRKYFFRTPVYQIYHISEIRWLAAKTATV
jgi:hypothetical protein